MQAGLFYLMHVSRLRLLTWATLHMTKGESSEIEISGLHAILSKSHRKKTLNERHMIGSVLPKEKRKLNKWEG